MSNAIYGREQIYFYLRVLFSLVGLFIISWLISLGGSTEAGAGQSSLLMTFVTYVLILVFYFGIFKLFLIGHLKGSGVQIGENQFPAVHEMIHDIAQQFGLKHVPKVFLVQSGGVLNAFATRFGGKNYIALYSDIFSLIENEPSVLKFVLAHEMAHVKRKHMQKRFWTFLSFYVPFLGPAYSRACEYTCDSLASSTANSDATKGLLLLAAGKDLYGKVNLEQYLADFKGNNTFAVRFVEMMSSHPNLPKRLSQLRR